MRILLADDQPGVRYALATLLKRQPGVELAGEAACAADCLTIALTEHADLLLIDWELPGLSAELLRTLRQMRPDLWIIALSGWPEVSPAALAAGADAFVSKAEPADQLLAAIARLGDGKRVGARTPLPEGEPYTASKPVAIGNHRRHK